MFADINKDVSNQISSVLLDDTRVHTKMDGVIDRITLLQYLNHVYD